MNDIVFSILLILIGLFVGIIFMIILNSIKLMNASKKVQSLLDNAKKEADKLKRDSILEAKEENHRKETRNQRLRRPSFSARREYGSPRPNPPKP